MQYHDGILAATLTSFDQNLSIDWQDMRTQIERLAAKNSLRGFVVNAFAGEGPTLSRTEMTQSIAIHREYARPEQAVVAAILDLSTASAINQAKEAKEAGADALLICPPIASSWNAKDSPHIAEIYHKEIASAIDLPIILFQYVVGDPNSYGHELLIKLVEEIPSVIGVKMAQANDTVRYDRDYMALKKLSKSVYCFPAVGSSMFHNLVSGADGVLTGLACLMPDEVIGMWEAVKAGDYRTARSIHFRMAPINHMIYGQPFVDLHTRYKELAFMLGTIASPVVRSPQSRVSNEERARLRQVLVEAGLIAPK